MKLDGTDIKQVLTGLRENQIAELEVICVETRRSRAEIIREAIDLWMRAFAMSKQGAP